jgi:hypothetical protein
VVAQPVGSIWVNGRLGLIEGCLIFVDRLQGLILVVDWLSLLSLGASICFHKVGSLAAVSLGP